MILMVDDEKRWVSGYKDALELSGYRCELIDDVDDLGRFLDNKDGLASIDLVIMDIMMAPRNRYKNEDTQEGMNTGNFVLSELRKLRPDMPIIVLTNKDRDINGEMTLKLCDHYLMKEDIVPDELVKLIDTMLRRNQYEDR